jgi:hypothetical protein
VTGHLDLNRSPSLGHPIAQDLEKIFSSKPMLIKVQLPRSGFVPGEEIPVSICVANRSHVHIKAVKIKLIRVAEYNAYEYQKSEERTLQVRKIICLNMLSPVHLEENILVPLDTLPSSGPSRRTIILKYEVKVTVEARGLHLEPIVIVPITIGTVPFANCSTPSEPVTSVLEDRRETTSASTDALIS